MRLLLSFSFLTLLVCITNVHAQNTQAQNAAPAESVSNGEAEVEVVKPEAAVSLETEAGSLPIISESEKAYGAFQRGHYLTALQLALPEAEKGDAAAQTLIAEIYDQGLGVARDPKNAAKWYKIAATSGNREAKFAYSVKLMQGLAVERDVERGLELMKQAADDGHPVAMFNYANHLVDQRPTSATYRKVLPLYEKAAEYRLADAFYALAKIYEDGLATGINDVETGRKWLTKAAVAGIDTAQVELGLKILDENPDSKQQKEAVAWLRIAASTGNVIAQNRLAHLFFADFGNREFRLEGAKWYILSRRAGRSDISLDLQFQTMVSEERQKALELANQTPISIANNAARLQRF